MFEIDLQSLMNQPLWGYYVSVMLVMAPVVRIFMRAGFRPYWALMLLIPWAGYIGCAAVLALFRWPVAASQEEGKA